MNLTIYFLRHGETDASRTGGFCGTLDPDLLDRLPKLLPHGLLLFGAVECT